jgi:hypothetical protein
MFAPAPAASCIARHAIAASVGQAHRDHSRMITVRFDERSRDVRNRCHRLLFAVPLRVES